MDGYNRILELHGDGNVALYRDTAPQTKRIGKYKLTNEGKEIEFTDSETGITMHGRINSDSIRLPGSPGAYIKQ